MSPTDAVLIPLNDPMLCTETGIGTTELKATGLNPVECTRLATLASSLFLLDHNDAGRFVDPGDDPTYPIWSTVFVLDAQGTIRHKDVRGDRMDKVVETLLAEMGHENALSGEATEDLLDESPDDSETDS